MDSTDQGTRRQDRRRNDRRAVAAVVGLLAVAVGLLSTAGIYAALSGRATGSVTATTGTLTLKVAPAGGFGFSDFVQGLAPGDVDNVFVTFTNTGTLATAKGMTLWVAGAPTTALTSGAVPGEGLTVTVQRCSVAWTVATGHCRGRTTTLLAARAVHTFDTAGTAVALAGVPALAAATGKEANLRVGLSLTGTETSYNGVRPAATIQGLATTLTYTFTVAQRTATATIR